MAPDGRGQGDPRIAQACESLLARKLSGSSRRRRGDRQLVSAAAACEHRGVDGGVIGFVAAKQSSGAGVGGPLLCRELDRQLSDVGTAKQSSGAALPGAWITPDAVVRA